MSFKPSLWASWVPRSPFYRKPNHYAEMFRVAWQNRDQIPFAWRILNHGVCDGCALGTSGMKDWTQDGPHLCMVRLELMRLNTAPPLDASRLADAAQLARLDSRELRELGRLPEPMIRRKGDRGFRVISWEEAYREAADKIRAADRQRFAVYLTSRGILNEHYYAAQKAARAMGTNHVDNSARLCHAASTVGMKRTLGYGASTCSYRDWIGSDLIVLFGSNVANNQPVAMKYLYYARQAGTKVAVVNPYLEPGLDRYWVPSVPESAIFGTKIADAWIGVNTGGDLAFLTGVFKVLAAENWVEREFIAQNTAGFEDAVALAAAQDWEVLERESGATRGEMRNFAAMLRDARSGIFIWGMGLTQHAHGVQTIEALVNVALARGWVGREKCGLVPIRGHSGVQGGAEVGCSPAVDLQAYEHAWGFAPPSFQGYTATDMIDAAYRGNLDVLWTVGGNFLETIPDPAAAKLALERTATRIHQDIVFTSMMLAEPQDTVLLLPATTRYESPGGGTETTTERRIVFSPEIPGRRIGSAKPEWEVFGEVAVRVRPELGDKVHFKSSQQIRDEIGRVVPLYSGIEKLSLEGDQFQWGGARLFSDGRFATTDGKAHFTRVAVPERAEAGKLHVSSRRGKQFNSMVQNGCDPLTRASRDDILISSEDAQRAGVADGAHIRLRSAAGTYVGRARIDRIKPGNLEVHWPEGNALFSRDRIDPASHEPDYNAEVEVEIPERL
jgi:molybdopterin-dependent oxidoreductase alpha subunit